MKVNRPAIEANYAGYQLTAADEALRAGLPGVTDVLVPAHDWSGDIHIIERTPVLTLQLGGGSPPSGWRNWAGSSAEGAALCRKSDFWHLPGPGLGR